MYEEIERIEDLQDEWYLAKRNIDKMVYQKAEEEGVMKELMAEFNHFDINHMYKAQKSSSLCYSCSKGLPCFKHKCGIARQDDVRTD